MVRTLWVLGTDSAARLTMQGLEPTPPVTFKTWGNELTVSPDGQRLYMLNGEYLYTYDVATGQKTPDVRTGRMGMKTLLASRAPAEERETYLAFLEATQRPQGWAALEQHLAWTGAPRRAPNLRPLHGGHGHSSAETARDGDTSGRGAHRGGLGPFGVRNPAERARRQG